VIIELTRRYLLYSGSFCRWRIQILGLEHFSLSNATVPKLDLRIQMIIQLILFKTRRPHRLVDKIVVNNIAGNLNFLRTAHSLLNWLLDGAIWSNLIYNVIYFSLDSRWTPRIVLFMSYLIEADGVGTFSIHFLENLGVLYQILLEVFACLSCFESALQKVGLLHWKAASACFGRRWAHCYRVTHSAFSLRWSWLFHWFALHAWSETRVSNALREVVVWLGFCPNIFLLSVAVSTGSRFILYTRNGIWTWIQ
jgi:hypothetical protein